MLTVIQPSLMMSALGCLQMSLGVWRRIQQEATFAAKSMEIFTAT
jgi:hypothetical protein